MAFPCVFDVGMTLRDYFAAKAMQSLIAANSISRDGEPIFEYRRRVASEAHSWADAMLAAREKGSV